MPYRRMNRLNLLSVLQRNRPVSVKERPCSLSHILKLGDFLCCRLFEGITHLNNPISPVDLGLIFGGTYSTTNTIFIYCVKKLCSKSMTMRYKFSGTPTFSLGSKNIHANIYIRTASELHGRSLGNFESFPNKGCHKDER